MPFVNVEEKKEGINRSVGRSTGVPRGVYRFKTHEEADEWMEKMLAKSAPLKKDQQNQPPQV